MQWGTSLATCSQVTRLGVMDRWISNMSRILCYSLHSGAILWSIIKKQPHSLWKIFVNICCYLSGSRGLCWAELNCPNVRSKSDNIVASEHCHNPRLCRYLHFLPHSQLAALLTSPQSPGRAEISKIFIYCSGLLCPGNVPGHAGEETRSYGLQLAATATLHQLHTRDGEGSY